MAAERPQPVPVPELAARRIELAGRIQRDIKKLPRVTAEVARRGSAITSTSSLSEVNAAALFRTGLDRITAAVKRRTEILREIDQELVSRSGEVEQLVAGMEKDLARVERSRARGVVYSSTEQEVIDRTSRQLGNLHAVSVQIPELGVVLGAKNEEALAAAGTGIQAGAENRRAAGTAADGDREPKGAQVRGIPTIDKLTQAVADEEGALIPSERSLLGVLMRVGEGGILLQPIADEIGFTVDTASKAIKSLRGKLPDMGITGVRIDHNLSPGKGPRGFSLRITEEVTMERIKRGRFIPDGILAAVDSAVDNMRADQPDVTAIIQRLVQVGTIDPDLDTPLNQQAADVMHQAITELRRRRNYSTSKYRLTAREKKTLNNKIDELTDKRHGGDTRAIHLRVDTLFGVEGNGSGFGGADEPKVLAGLTSLATAGAPEAAAVIISPLERYLDAYALILAPLATRDEILRAGGLRSVHQAERILHDLISDIRTRSGAPDGSVTAREKAFSTSIDELGGLSVIHQLRNDRLGLYRGSAFDRSHMMSVEHLDALRLALREFITKEDATDTTRGKIMSLMGNILKGGELTPQRVFSELMGTLKKLDEKARANYGNLGAGQVVGVLRRITPEHGIGNEDQPETVQAVLRGQFITEIGRILGVELPGDVDDGQGASAGSRGASAGKEGLDGRVSFILPTGEVIHITSRQGRVLTQLLESRYAFRTAATIAGRIEDKVFEGSIRLDLKALDEALGGTAMTIDTVKGKGYLIRYAHEPRPEFGSLNSIDMELTAAVLLNYQVLVNTIFDISGIPQIEGTSGRAEIGAIEKISGEHGLGDIYRFRTDGQRNRFNANRRQDALARVASFVTTYDFVADPDGLRQEANADVFAMMQVLQRVARIEGRLATHAKNSNTGIELFTNLIADQKSLHDGIVIEMPERTVHIYYETTYENRVKIRKIKKDVIKGKPLEESGEIILSRELEVSEMADEAALVRSGEVFPGDAEQLSEPESDLLPVAEDHLIAIQMVAERDSEATRDYLTGLLTSGQRRRNSAFRAYQIVNGDIGRLRRRVAAGLANPDERATLSLVAAHGGPAVLDIAAREIFSIPSEGTVHTFGNTVESHRAGSVAAGQGSGSGQNAEQGGRGTGAKVEKRRRAEEELRGNLRHTILVVLSHDQLPDGPRTRGEIARAFGSLRRFDWEGNSHLVAAANSDISRPVYEADAIAVALLLQRGRSLSRSLQNKLPRLAAEVFADIQREKAAAAGGSK